MEKDTIKALVLYISPNIISVLIAFILIELKQDNIAIIVAMTGLIGTISVVSVDIWTQINKTKDKKRVKEDDYLKKYVKEYIECIKRDIEKIELHIDDLYDSIVINSLNDTKRYIIAMEEINDIKRENIKKDELDIDTLYEESFMLHKKKLEIESQLEQLNEKIRNRTKNEKRELK